MKRLVPEFQFQEGAKKAVRELAASLSLTETTASVLYARGLDTAEKARTFLSPSREHFLSPFLMKGMKEAVDLLKQARDEEWRVAVYGDYDADGIGACAVLSRALVKFGIEPYVYVPERTEGYGMSVPAVDKIFDEFLPDLIVTVDCGISNRKEVEYIKEQGAYVIVTDHHELPEELPDCIIVNPKLKDDYPYDNLCGAGVAFKLAYALTGDFAYSLLDFAALSTVADSVPLLGENRDIVAEGLKLIKKNPRPALKALLANANEITAQTLAFTVAPRINAAGRMGDAKAALRMFLSEDEEEIYDIAGLLGRYNSERQKYCDDLYSQAISAIHKDGAYDNIVMLAGENWNAGTVGIVAARIVEQFSRPALLFVKNGDMLRGSARSVDNINIFEALKACSEYIEEFGGHAQAAGVNVREENFSKLKSALNEYLGAHYLPEDFAPTVTVSGKGCDFSKVAHELEQLEPFGVGNRRPLFTLEAGGTNAAPIKPLSPHIGLCIDKLDLINFNGGKMLKTLRSDLRKTVVFDYNISTFRGRETVKGFVRAVLYDGTSGADVELDAFENRVRALASSDLNAEKFMQEQLNGFLEKKIAECAYGLCCVCYERGTLSRFPAINGIAPDVFSLSSGSVGNAVLVAPDSGYDLSAYREVVFLDFPAAGVKTGNARVIALEEADKGNLLKIDLSRETLLSIFSAIKNSPVIAGDSLADVARNCGGLGFSPEMFVFALAVFEELGLVNFRNGVVSIVRGVKTELANSAIYSKTLRLQEN